MIDVEALIETVGEAAQVVRDSGIDRVDLAIVLGSGLSAFAADLEDPVRIAYGALPGFKPATVKGHTGELVIGRLGAVSVMVFSGRMHPYEGIEPWRVGLLPRLASALGARLYIVTNASGGIPGKGVHPGDLMRITDQLNLQGVNPLVGPHDDRLGARFPDMGQPYDRGLGARLDALAERLDIPLKRGVYIGVMGPGYETPAEVRMYGICGADTVGMSTVGEVLVARQVGLKVVGMSCISNYSGGNDGAEILTHSDVTAVVGAAAARFVRLLGAAVPELMEAL